MVDNDGYADYDIPDNVGNTLGLFGVLQQTTLIVVRLLLKLKADH